MSIIIIGSSGGTHIGASLARAANKLALPNSFIDTFQAHTKSRFLRSIFWRYIDRRPANLNRFSRNVLMQVETCKNCDFLISTGQAPLTAEILRKLKQVGVVTANFSTDDPWNSVHQAKWHLDALPEYDVIFTPRRANISDFKNIGCRFVHFLPFAYDDELFGKTTPQPSLGLDVLFVGGADPDRVEFFKRYSSSTKINPSFVGGYWQRYSEFSSSSLGSKSPSLVANLTAAAGVNLCLVRRANRDGHVMRSFEIPAVGGFILAENTKDHRDIFGDEGKNALYFESPEEASEKTKWALSHPDERRNMSSSAHDLISSGNHTYRHRLQEMLDILAEIASLR